MDITQQPELEQLRFASDASWLEHSRGLDLLDDAYRVGRGALYAYLSMYWWLGSGLGGPRSGGKIGSFRDAMMRRGAHKRALKRAREPLSAHELAAVADGEAVAITGTIRPRTLLDPALHDQGAVYHRVDLQLKWSGFLVRKYDHLVYDAATDFDLQDAGGDIVRVEVARAVLVVPPAPLTDFGWAPIARLSQLPGPKAALEHMKGRDLMQSQAGHTRLREGDRVTVYGWKGSVVDPTVMERTERETPMRAAVRSSEQGRLLIFPGAAAQTPG